MQKGSSKVIVDAERHRRTPRTLAVESKALESKKSADIGRHWRGKKRKKHAKTMNISPKRVPKSLKYHQNGSQNRKNGCQNRFKTNEKSMKNRGCVADAFLERFGAPQWSNRPTRLGSVLAPFSIKNLKKCAKGAERDPKVEKKGI